MPKRTDPYVRRGAQLTLVATPYAAQLLRTVAHVRSLRHGRGVSMSEVFRDAVEANAQAFEDEIRDALGAKAVEGLHQLRDPEPSEITEPAPRPRR